jgi:hypothetical protein
MAISRHYRIPVSSTRRLRLLAIAVAGAVGVSSAAHAIPLTVSGAYLFYQNQGPNDLGFAVGQEIRYGANPVVPTIGAGTTGVATTTNLSTGALITHTINADPNPASPDQTSGDFLICATTCTPTSSTNPANLTGPWTLTFQNPSTTPTSVSTQLSLVGPGEAPFVNSVTLSGTSANPVFSWTPPAGTAVNGYRINIYQNNLRTSSYNGNILSVNLGPTVTSYTVQASDFTVPGTSLQNNTAYTISISLIQTKNGSTTNLNNHNVSAISYVYSTFQTLPAGTPPVNLPTVTLVGNQVIYGFNLTVQPGITYYLDPEVATGYIYQTGMGNPNFASVELPDIGNPSPYELYLWNGTDFVFDTMLAADTTLDFGGTGVSEFEVLGIDPSLGLDPTNPTAFVTALTFEGAGSFTGTMTPITTNVPEPTSLTLFVCGLLGFGSIRRRRKAFIR